uniref:Polymerase (DNA directed) nu n=1 Tax=Salarias fasciatus TaxID=181472 RepID=A0A672FQA6_SALFA
MAQFHEYVSVYSCGFSASLTNVPPPPPLKQKLAPPVHGLLVLMKSDLTCSGLPRDSPAPGDCLVYLRLERTPAWAQQQTLRSQQLHTRCVPQLVVCYKAKDFLRTVLQFYTKDLSWTQVAGCHVQDPQVSGWLLDPADSSSCFQDLLNKHCREPHKIPTVGPQKVRRQANLLTWSVCAWRRYRRGRNYISSTWLQTSAVTGRISAKHPVSNGGPTLLHSPQDRVELSVVLIFSTLQVELRLLAHLSADPELLRIFSSPQADVFTMLASQWFSEVTSGDREHAKRIVYSVVYGAGYVVSIMGRRRTLPNITSPVWGARMQAERQAVNFVVQGSAADFCKMAMIRIFNLISCSGSLSVRLIAQLHDELLFEVEDSQLERFGGILRPHFHGVLGVCLLNNDVPLKVAVSSGKSWGSMSKLNILSP